MTIEHSTIIDETNYSEACDKIYAYLSEQPKIDGLESSNIKDIISDSFVSGISYIKFFTLVVDKILTYI